MKRIHISSTWIFKVSSHSSFLVETTDEGTLRPVVQPLVSSAGNRDNRGELLAESEDEIYRAQSAVQSVVQPAVRTVLDRKSTRLNSSHR